jgi:hypothetical protein
MWHIIVGLLPGPDRLWLLILFLLVAAFVIRTAATGF